MSNVEDLDVVTRLDIPSDKILKKAIGNVNDVIIIGWNEEGELYFASSKANGGDVLWLLELAKKRLLEACE